METLRRLRTEKGLSQARLAARAVLDPSTVNQIERGAREASPATLRKLADALDVSIADLLEDTSPKALRRSSLEPSLLNGLEEERRTPTPSERRAVGALEDRANHLEAVLETAKRRTIPLEVWRLESDYALDIAGLALPLIEQEHLRPLLRPVAARFTELAYAVLDGLKDAGSTEEAERQKERMLRMTREIA
jgi:transcriptional regulator with XRE-family HTH domain